MSARSLARAPLAAKVPEITVMFWVIKVLTTGMGEATSDFLANGNLVLAAVAGIGAFAVAMYLQFRARRYGAWTYWFAVAMVAVFGTMAADGLHKGLGLPYTVTTVGYAVAVAVILTLWYRSEGTLSIHSITTTRREVFYWLTVLATFALGTAAGDFTAYTLHMGLFSSGVLFGCAILVPLVAWRLGANAVLCFWTAYVLTRPLGASFADYFGKDHTLGGRGDGDGTVAVIVAIVIVVLVAVLARAGSGRSASSVDERAHGVEVASGSGLTENA